MSVVLGLMVRQLQLSLVTFFALCVGLAIALAMPIPLYLATRVVREANVAHKAAQVLTPSF